MALNKRFSMRASGADKLFQPPYVPQGYFTFNPTKVDSKKMKLEVSGEKTNKVIWNITVKDNNISLPSDLPFALLIHHGVPFQATISVSARTAGLRSALKDGPGVWKIDFDGETEVGKFTGKESSSSGTGSTGTFDEEFPEM
ncbi:hypothetical protein BT69DRAFT_1322979 [Atractiella rhizophila]|nr:hypothetical protein BT69DRAFT_1322979 [Atractiella rhizophila]